MLCLVGLVHMVTGLWSGMIRLLFLHTNSTNLASKYKSCSNVLCFDESFQCYRQYQLMFLSQARRLVTQHSGLVWAASGFNTDTLVIDSWPFYLGAGRSEDVMLFKKIIYKSSEITIEQAIQIDPNILWNTNPSQPSVDPSFALANNSPADVLKAFLTPSTLLRKPSEAFRGSQLYEAKPWIA